MSSLDSKFGDQGVNVARVRKRWVEGGVWQPLNQRNGLIMTILTLFEIREFVFFSPKDNFCVDRIWTH